MLIQQTHLAGVGAPIDGHHQHVCRQASNRVCDGCRVLGNPERVQRAVWQEGSGCVSCYGVPQLAVDRERPILDRERQLAHKIERDDAVVGGIRQAGQLRAVCDAWEFLSNEIKARHSSVHVRAREAEPEGPRGRERVRETGVRQAKSTALSV